MAANILVYIDHFQGQAGQSSWEAVGAARSLAQALGGEVTALVAAADGSALAAQAIQHGADRALVSDDPALAEYRAEPYASTVAKMARHAGGSALLFPTTGRTRELAGMVAVDLETGVTPDAIALEVKDGSVLATRPIYAGKLLTKEACLGRLHVLTLRARAFPKPEPSAGKSGPIENVPADVGAPAPEVLGYKATGGGVSLTDAGVIVSGGRGVSNNPKLTPPAEITDEKQKEVWRAQQGFVLVRDLASALGAAVGASRAAVDAGYIPYAHQVGQTGKVVSPDLYIACGISGAIQHLAGMRTSKTIVAVNKDPEAPIFRVARFGIVGDLFEVLPALTKAFKAKLGK
ncbi:MAG TPA: electron transfer flavoprotein subunit alpha/FixB family protein [Anaerolineales bacterium]|nr:electron transfer flavoprotein subunit alpha/FixB family protein [Anaerolineales bacterium]